MQTLTASPAVEPPDTMPIWARLTLATHTTVRFDEVTCWVPIDSHFIHVFTATSLVGVERR